MRLSFSCSTQVYNNFTALYKPLLTKTKTTSTLSSPSSFASLSLSSNVWLQQLANAFHLYVFNSRQRGCTVFNTVTGQRTQPNSPATLMSGCKQSRERHGTVSVMPSWSLLLPPLRRTASQPICHFTDH